MSSDTSDTFGGFWDRFTHIVAEAQFLVGGLLVSGAIGLLWLRPQVPGVPPIVMGWMASLLLLGPPTFGFFVWLIKKIRTRNMVSVHHVNGLQDVVKKYYVEPEIWSEKAIDGPNPYPVNGGDGWAVQEFDYDEEMGQLRIRGVWLEECSDVNLLTKKSHMESVYDTLTQSHIALNIMRDSISELGANIQKRITNRMDEARERGKMMDKTAIKEVFEDFETSIEDTGPDDLPILEGEEIEGEPVTGVDEIGAEGTLADLDAEADAAATAAATDGGTNQ